MASPQICYTKSKVSPQSYNAPPAISRLKQQATSFNETILTTFIQLWHEMHDLLLRPMMNSKYHKQSKIQRTIGLNDSVKHHQIKRKLK